MQAVDELGPPGGPLVEGRVVELVAGPAVLLGHVHGAVGPRHQHVGVVAGFHEGDADGGRGEELGVGGAEGLDEGRADALGDADGLGLGVEQVLAQDDELVTAQAGHRVAGAQHLAEPVGHTDDQLVARRMAPHVVDGLEAVDVDEEDGRADGAPGGGVDGLGQALEEEDPVGQARQRVVQGLVGEAALLLGQLGLQLLAAVVEALRHDEQAPVEVRVDAIPGFAIGRHRDPKTACLHPQRRQHAVAPVEMDLGDLGELECGIGRRPTDVGHLPPTLVGGGLTGGDELRDGHRRGAADGQHLGLHRVEALGFAPTLDPCRDRLFADLVGTLANGLAQRQQVRLVNSCCHVGEHARRREISHRCLLAGSPGENGGRVGRVRSGNHPERAQASERQSPAHLSRQHSCHRHPTPHERVRVPCRPPFLLAGPPSNG